MADLPYGILVADAASAGRYDAQLVPLKALPSDDPRRLRATYDYSMVGFVATTPVHGAGSAPLELSSAVSPRGLLTIRTLPAIAGTGYIGFGDAVRPAGGVLASLPERGVFRGNCSTAQAARIQRAIGDAKRIDPAELDIAKQYFGTRARTVTGVDFTADAVAAAHLHDYPIIHFATHGLAANGIGCDNPPALLTSVGSDPDSDGLLVMDRISRLPLAATLVVLSACDTAAAVDLESGETSGFGASGGANGLSGLFRAFLAAGARSVLTTYWSIPDKSMLSDVRPPVRLMEILFRTGVNDRLSIGAAVQRGQMALQSDPGTSHPGMWGAFVLIGDGSQRLVAAPLQTAAR